MVPDQVVHLPLRLPLGASDVASLPLRPVDAPRMESADSVGDPQPRRHGLYQIGIALMGQTIAFYILAAFILGFAIMVVTTKDTVHSVLFLVIDFLFVAALYALLGA